MKVLVVCDCPDIYYFMVGFATKTSGVRVDAPKAVLRDLLLKFERTYCSLVVASQFLDESRSVGALSLYFASHPKRPWIMPCIGLPSTVSSLLDPLPHSPGSMRIDMLGGLIMFVTYTAWLHSFYCTLFVASVWRSALCLG